MVMHWFRPRGHAEDFLPDRFPIHIWQLDDGLMFYGFPAADARAEGVKVALHNRNMLPCTPATIDRSVHEDEVEAMRALMAAYLPDLDGEHADARTCMYTMTPDEAFIIDVHPLWPSIALAAGFSGHGFKFASVVGEVLADLACDGATRHDIRLFALNRFQNRGEHDKPSDVR
jgi:sarcosine oxidase